VGLDLYAGTLTRYYSGKWLTTVQQASKEMGIPVSVDYASGAAPWLPPERAAAAVAEFATQLSKRWGARHSCFARPPIWNEDQSTPYLTEKPDHDGIRSLVLVAAYLERSDLRRPQVLPVSLDLDPAYAEAMHRGYYIGPMAVFEAQLFLPGDASFLVVQRDPLGATRYITSIGDLKQVIADVNGRSWNASPELLEAWRKRGLCSSGPVQKVWKVDPQQGMKVVEEPNLVVDKVEHNAQFAMGCFWRLCEFAETHNVPIVVDQ
jgi:hypothetical protein